MPNGTPSEAGDTTAAFTFFPDLPAELRLKISHHALSNPRIIALNINHHHHLWQLTAPHPLLYTNHESRTCALRTQTGHYRSKPRVPKLFLNTRIDYLFLTNLATLKYTLESNVNHPGRPGGSNAMANSVRRLAVPLAAFETLLKQQQRTQQYQPSVPGLLRAFPNLEEVVLVVGERKDAREEVLRLGDLEFVMPAGFNVPRAGVLVELCVWTFQPWRAFEHLLGVEMLEDAVGQWVEGLATKRDGLDAVKVPNFSIREVKSASRSNT
jgi:2EXR family